MARAASPVRIKVPGARTPCRILHILMPSSLSEEKTKPFSTISEEKNMVKARSYTKDVRLKGHYAAGHPFPARCNCNLYFYQKRLWYVAHTETGS